MLMNQRDASWRVFDYDLAAHLMDERPPITGPNGEKVTVILDLDEALRSNVGAGYRANCRTMRAFGGQLATLKEYVAEFNGYDFYKKRGIFGTSHEVNVLFKFYYKPEHEMFSPVAGAREVL